MNYTKKDLGSFRLHLIRTNKFKTVTMKVLFHTPIKKEDITKRILLSDILLQSSKKYESKRSMTIEAEELYSASISTGNQRLGNYIFTSFNLQVLNDKYTEEGNLEKSIEFLSEILFHPNINQKSFLKDKLDLAKYNTVVNLSTIKENTTNYSMIKLLEKYDSESPVSYQMQGYLDDLEKIDEKNLYDSYLKMIDNDYVDIFIVGDFDSRKMISIIKKYYKFKKIKKKKESYYLPVKKPRKKRQFAKEAIDNTQSKLSIALPIMKLTPFERDYVLTLANLIYGGGTDSKLFQNIREKNSLCYTIRSFISKLDNLMVVTAGIDKTNYEKTVNLITSNLLDLKKGKFTDKDINIAKEIYDTSLEEIEESPLSMINEALSETIFDVEEISIRKEKISKVRKSDITRVLKKINMDTVFLLEGVKNEEN